MSSADPYITVMPKSQKVKLPRRRAPNGVVTQSRLRMALRPDELEELERRAEADGRTLSAMARIFMVRGMVASRDEPGALVHLQDMS